MCYSYVMGVDPSIEALKEEGFLVEKDGANYTVTSNYCCLSTTFFDFRGMGAPKRPLFCMRFFAEGKCWARPI